MVSNDAFQNMILSFEGVTASTHFNKASYKFKNKIIATLDPTGTKAMVKLSPSDQAVYCKFNSNIFEAVSGSWGIKGYTFINLELLDSSILKEIIEAALRVQSPVRKRR